MTSTIIDRVHQIAKEQGSPIGLTFGDHENKVTILDIETDKQPDDDDASDASYVTELTGVVTESSESTSELPPGTEYTWDDTDGVPERIIENDGNRPDDDNFSIADAEDARSDPPTEQEQDIPDNEENGNNDDDEKVTEDNQQPEEGQVNEEEQIDFEKQDIEPIEIQHPSPLRPTRQSRRKMNLNPIAPGDPIHHKLRPHNKEPDKGTSFFTTGFSTVVAKLEREQAEFMMVAAAVGAYHEMEAS